LLHAATEEPTHLIGGALWLRVAAYAYNQLDDYARLPDIVATALRGNAP